MPLHHNCYKDLQSNGSLDPVPQANPVATHRSADEEQGLRQLRSFLELPDELDTIFVSIDLEAGWYPRYPVRIYEIGISIMDTRNLCDDPSTTNVDESMSPQNTCTGAWFGDSKVAISFLFSDTECFWHSKIAELLTNSLCTEDLGSI